jgi:polyisoprenoid-binding protein YceI
MRLFSAALILSALTACVPDVGEGSVAAKVEPAQAEKVADPAAAAPAAQVQSFAVDAGRSKIEALGAKVTATHPVMFGDFSGKVGLEGEQLRTLSFQVVMASLESDHPKLTEHLKDADFFDVANHPTSTFVSTEIKEGSEVAGRTHTVTGNLTVRGNTKSVTFPATIVVTEREARADTEFVINRQDFGITYPGRADDLVQDNVKMTISFLAPRG